MTQEELAQYVELHEKFENECERVCNILKDSKERHGKCNDIDYAERFSLANDSVDWEGDEYWNYGGYEEHHGYFPTDFLTMSNDKLLKIVEMENKEWEAEQEKRNKEKAAQEKEKRKAQYEELKKEFGE